MRHHMNLGIVPIHQFSVKPDFLRLGDWHRYSFIEFAPSRRNLLGNDGQYSTANLAALTLAQIFCAASVREELCSRPRSGYYRSWCGSRNKEACVGSEARI